MTGIVDILEGANYVVKNSTHVKINIEKIKEFCKEHPLLEEKHWLENSPCEIFVSDFEKRLNLIFLINSISFCYWEEPKWRFFSKKNIYDGTWGLICAILRKVNEGIEIYDFNYLSRITIKEFSNIFETPNNRLPLINERYQILKEVSNVINKKYDGSIKIYIESVKNDALKILERLVTDFENFNDYSIYKGEKIYFYKRAQLAVSDLAYECQKNGYDFTGLDKLTACADYKIPMVLNFFGILEYDRELKNRIDVKEKILENSEEEVEIRGNTIWAVDLIRKVLQDDYKRDLNNMNINDYLWLLSQDKAKFKSNYHRTITQKY